MSRSGTRLRWQEIIGEQPSSGLSIAEFCRRNEVSQASFYQWRKKLGKPAPAHTPFVPLSVMDGVGVSVELPCGAVVRLPAGDDRSLSQIISLLMAAEEQSR